MQIVKHFMEMPHAVHSVRS